MFLIVILEGISFSLYVLSSVIAGVLKKVINFGIFIIDLAVLFNSHFFLIAFQMIPLGFLDISDDLKIT